MLVMNTFWLGLSGGGPLGAIAGVGSTLCSNSSHSVLRFADGSKRPGHEPERFMMNPFEQLPANCSPAFSQGRQWSKEVAKWLVVFFLNKKTFEQKNSKRKDTAF